ncbi:MAG: helix-turn-helix domain-containing protein [Christensenellaceae bacterium]|nr:helix-turn-helix domain-containing protein [Christensenellaceae bacterium]
MKKRDPKTALKWRTVQYMIKQGAITPIKFGDAWLINIDELYNYFTKAGKNE